MKLLDLKSIKFEMGGGKGLGICCSTEDDEWPRLFKMLSEGDKKGVKEFTVRAYGWTICGLHEFPCEGELVKAEFESSWMIFKIWKLRRPDNPSDQFFLKMKFYTRLPKEIKK